MAERGRRGSDERERGRPADDLRETHASAASLHRPLAPPRPADDLRETRASAASLHRPLAPPRPADDLRETRASAASLHRPLAPPRPADDLRETRASAASLHRRSNHDERSPDPAPRPPRDDLAPERSLIGGTFAETLASDDLSLGTSSPWPPRAASASAASLGAETLASTLKGPGLAPPPAAAPPRAIGRYVVIDRLGAGGMGVVYRAYDPDLDRRVAVKVLRGRATPSARARLLREAQAMAKLSHPHVVSIFDVGVVGDQVFIAMDYVDGEDLAAWLEREPRPWPDVLDVFTQAAAGLEAAHRVGLVHRDFKPENVLLARDPAGGRPRAQVADFGLARLGGAADDAEDDDLAAAGSALRHDLTGAGAVMGTPAYMSPEQFAGAAVDARTDVYALSVALYEALYRQRPYDADTLAAMAAAASGPRRPPPPRTPVPAWLHAALLRGMSPDRERRFQGMSELLAALAAGRARARRRWILGAAGLTALGLGLGLGLREPPPPPCAGGAERVAAIWSDAPRAAGARAFAATGAPYAAASWERAAARLDAYAAAWADGYADACAATKLRGELSEAAMDLRMACLNRRLQAMAGLSDMFSQADPKIVERAVDAAAELPEVAACADLEALRGGPPPPPPRLREPVRAAQERLAAARALQGAGKDREALALLGPLAAEAAALGHAPLTVEVGLALGEAEADTGAHEAGARTLQAALWAAIAAADDAAAFDAARRLIHVVGFQLARADEAELWAAHAEALARRRGGRPRDRGALLRARAAVALAAGQNDAAERLAEEAVALAAAGDPAEALRRVDRLTALGAARIRGGRYAAAEAPLREAVDLAERLRGPDHPDLASPLSTLALVYERQARYDDAVAALERSLAIVRATQGPDHPNVGLLRQNLGGMLLLAGRLDQAGPELDAALAVLEASLGPSHPALGGALTFRGDLALERGDLDRAAADYARAAAIRAAALGDDHPDLGLPLLGLGRVALARGDRPLAAMHLEHALKNMSSGAVDPGDRGLVEVALAEALWRGDRPRARALAAAGLAALDRVGPPVARQREAAAAWLAAAEAADAAAAAAPEARSSAPRPLDPRAESP